MGTIMEDVLMELLGEQSNELGLPPGFRFHPTDEELVTFYLAAKVFNGGFARVGMVEIDLNRCEPWELPDAAKLGEREWYFYSLRDRKYPTGLRTNRATGAGYWKATGKDREVCSASNGTLVGMKKTLVFYKGRAPRGVKTKWVLHEYRLEGELSCSHACKEEWVICRIFYKAAGEKIRNHPFFRNGSRSLLESSPPSPTPPLPFPHLAETKTLESPTQFQIQDQPPYMFLKDNPQPHLNSLPPASLPLQFVAPTDISSLPKSDFRQHASAKETSPVPELYNGPLLPRPPEQAFFSLVDANPQDAFVLGVLPGLCELSFVGEQPVDDLSSSWLVAGANAGLEEHRPILPPWDVEGLYGR